MDVIKFNPVTAPTLLEDGEVVNGLRSKMWIERYLDAGEFKFVAPATTDMRDALPIGSLITHQDTREVMIVENHEISDERGKRSDIVITGRSFETILDQRIIGSNQSWPSTGGIVEYQLSAAYTWLQTVTLIQDHIYLANVVDPDDEIPYVTVSTDISGPTGPSVVRTIKRGSLYSRVLELMEIDKLGLKNIRSTNGGNIDMKVHQGVDKTATVALSYSRGEIESADYLWSNRRVKNCALVSGRWVDTLVDSADSKYDRRMMYVDASDLDSALTSAPTGAPRTTIVNKMQARGAEALAEQKDISLVKADASKDFGGPVYRGDYDPGDIVTVRGDYDEVASMRVSEFVEIQDEHGERGYPTLEAV